MQPSGRSTCSHTFRWSPNLAGASGASPCPQLGLANLARARQCGASPERERECMRHRNKMASQRHIQSKLCCAAPARARPTGSTGSSWRPPSTALQSTMPALAFARTEHQYRTHRRAVLRSARSLQTSGVVVVGQRAGRTDVMDDLISYDTPRCCAAPPCCDHQECSRARRGMRRERFEWVKKRSLSRLPRGCGWGGGRRHFFLRPQASRFLQINC